MSKSSHYSLLIQKLDQFIRKYYINKALKGVIFFAAVSVAVLLLYSLVEHQLFLPRGGRKLLFYSYLIGSIGAFIYWVVLPISQYFNLGRLISHDQAATILGDHFGDVKDKLLNVLQLNRNVDSANKELIEASINQKSSEISIVPFRKAIDLSKNKKYLKYAMPPMAVLLFLLFAAPSLITDSTYRIINNDRDFEREAPFKLTVANESLEVLQYEDYELRVTTTGDQLPDQVYVRIDDYDYRLSKEGSNSFSYRLSNVRKDTRFQLYSGKYRNQEATLKVLPKPKMVNFSLKLDYPNYTKQRDETVFNTGDITVPVGTKVSWEINAESAEKVFIKFDGKELVHLETTGSQTFVQSKRIRKDHNYSLHLTNEYLPVGDSLNFYIRSIEDKYPTIDVEMIVDSAEQNIFYFIGDGSDDYGLQSLSFVYTISDDYGQTISQSQKAVTMTPGTQIDFDYLLDLEDLGLEAGQKVSYYFELFDNDAINGSKSVKSSVMSYRKKSLEELKEEEQENEELVKDKLDSSIDEAKDIQEELKKLREKLLQKNKPDWQDKKKLEQLMERQQSLQEQLEEAKNANEKNLSNQNNLQQNNPQIQEKQERLQELFEEVVDDEMKDLMEEIQKLMEELGKEPALQKMEEFKMDEESLEKEMERLQELYKQLEVEKEINESVDKLEELAEELEELSEQTKEEEDISEQMKEEQERISEEFEELKEQMEELMEKNDDLEFPKDVPQDAPEQMEDINDDLQESEEQMEQNEGEKASSKQKQASQKMKQMAQQMQSQMMEGASEQMQEDIETLRQLLENLVTLSFDQEGLINNINRATINTPRYIGLVQEQMKIKDDFKVVEDTLQALSKRQPDLESFVLEKVTEAKHYLGKSLDQLEERNKPEANQSQRTTMTNLNDLALMLSESMEQMQQQMAGMMSGSQMCQKPGKNPGGKQGKGKSGNVPMDKISEGQEKMSEQLKKMSEQKKSGGKGGSAKDFAEAAAKQAALRKALQELQQEQQENGQGASDQLQKIIDEMDKQEVDLVNKRLDNDMLMRQQEILTRLLEADNAQKEREYDDERKSDEGKNLKRTLPPSIEEYIKQRKAQLEQYKYVSPEMKPHYKRLVEEYYKKLKRA